MPHYADGSEAKVGDQVIGELYNTPGVRAGVIVSITPGQEQCNCMVQFSEVVKPGAERLRMEISTKDGWYSRRFIKSEQHGSSGEELDVASCVDYCETKKLTKVG